MYTARFREHTRVAGAYESSEKQNCITAGNGGSAVALTPLARARSRKHSHDRFYRLFLRSRSARSVRLLEFFPFRLSRASRLESPTGSSACELRAISSWFRAHAQRIFTVTVEPRVKFLHRSSRFDSRAGFEIVSGFNPSRGNSETVGQEGNLLLIARKRELFDPGTFLLEETQSEYNYYLRIVYGNMNVCLWRSVARTWCVSHYLRSV